MRVHPHPARRQTLQRDGARRAERRGQAAGKLAAAADIVVSAEANVGRVIGVRGTDNAPQGLVVAAARVRVADEDAQRRAAGHAVRQPGDNLRRIRLAPRGGQRPLSGRAARQKRAQPLRIDAQPGGQPVHDGAHRLGMRLAEHGHPQPFSKRCAHARALPSMLSRPPSRSYSSKKVS